MESERTNLVERQADDAGLLGERLEDGLADPPHCIGYELESAGLVKLLGGLYQAEIAFVDKVGKAQALVLVLLGDGHHETEVRAGKLFKCGLVALADALGKFDFLLGRYQLLAANLLEILVQGSTLAVGDGLCNL